MCVHPWKMSVIIVIAVGATTVATRPSCAEEDSPSLMKERAFDDGDRTPPAMRRIRQHVEREMNAFVQTNLPYSKGMSMKMRNGQLHLIRKMDNGNSTILALDDDGARLVLRIPLGGKKR